MRLCGECRGRHQRERHLLAAYHRRGNALALQTSPSGGQRRSSALYRDPRELFSGRLWMIPKSSSRKAVRRLPRGPSLELLRPPRQWRRTRGIRKLMAIKGWPSSRGRGCGCFLRRKYAFGMRTRLPLVPLRLCYAWWSRGSGSRQRRFRRRPHPTYRRGRELCRTEGHCGFSTECRGLRST